MKRRNLVAPIYTVVNLRAEQWEAHMLNLRGILTTSVSAGGDDVESGPWYVIGPFKDSDFGIVAERLESRAQRFRPAPLAKEAGG